jgi:hypothetical protein
VAFITRRTGSPRLSPHCQNFLAQVPQTAAFSMEKIIMMEKNYFKCKTKKYWKIANMNEGMKHGSLPVIRL